MHDSFASASTIQANRRRWVALALQSLPLLAITSCVTRGALGEAVQQQWFTDIRYLVVGSALAWGLGYLPLRRWWRATSALLIGALASGYAANESLRVWSVAANGQGEAALQQASLIWAGLALIGLGGILVDTWRLTRD